MKQLSKLEIRQQLIDDARENIERDTRNISHFDLLLPIVRAHDGKPFGSRFRADCRVAVPSAGRYSIAGMFYIRVQSDDEKCRTDFIVGHTAAVSLATFESNTFAREPARQRIKRNAQLLADENAVLTNLIDAIADVRNGWRYITGFEFGTAGYEASITARRITGLKENR